MNRIKIIKRAGSQAPLESREAKKDSQTLTKPGAGKVVENWIN